MQIRNESKYLESQGIVPQAVNPGVNPGQSTVIVAGAPIPQPFYPPVKHRGIIDTYLLTIPLGFLGAHHFYLGRPGFGIVYLFTFGLLGVGWVVDWFRVPCLVKDANARFNDPSNVEHEKKSLSDAYVLWFPFGLLGFHHFYLHRWLWGITYFLSFGFFGIGWIIDGIRMKWLVEDYNKDQRTPGLKEKKLSDAYIMTLCPVTGLLGVQHYYLERYGFGIGYTLTLGFFGVGYLVDIVRMPLLVKRTNQIRERGSVEYEKVRLDDAYVLAFPLGFLGLHHFYLRRYVWGVLYFFTFGLLGIGMIVDWFRLPCLVRDYNKNVEMHHAAQGNSSIIVHPAVNNPVLGHTHDINTYGSNYPGPGYMPPAQLPGAHLPPYQPPYPVPHQYPPQGAVLNTYPPQQGGPPAPYGYPTQAYQHPNLDADPQSISTITSSEGDQPPSYSQATDESAQNSMNENQASAPPLFQKH